MRISDWSSDVCSSDLTSGRFGDAEAARDLKFRREDTSSFSATVGGDFDIGASLLNIEAGYTRATKRDPHRTEWSFETDGFGGSYDTTGIFPRYSVDDVAYDAANFDFNEVDYANRHAVERSEEHTSELPSLMLTSYSRLCLTQKEHEDRQTT